MLFLAGGHLLLFVMRAPVGHSAAPAVRAAVHRRRRGPDRGGAGAFGLLVPAPPWPPIGAVWAYAPVWTVLADIVKMVFNTLTADPKSPAPATASALPIN
ncbi:hypothetical protein [Methylocella sp.]|uniref:hypothetical protein n=1 Tax=Methylocella sp. TaxID=1978226 RepID=UPI0037849C99